MANLIVATRCNKDVTSSNLKRLSVNFDKLKHAYVLVKMKNTNLENKCRNLELENRRLKEILSIEFKKKNLRRKRTCNSTVRVRVQKENPKTKRPRFQCQICKTPFTGIDDFVDHTCLKL